jgi:hypothetical protein
MKSLSASEMRRSDVRGKTNETCIARMRFDAPIDEFPTLTSFAHSIPRVWVYPEVEFRLQLEFVRRDGWRDRRRM